MPDRIEKEIEVKAPISRVWRALTDYKEFGEWFRVALEGPFAPGQLVRGKVLYPGYEHLTWEAIVQKMEPERLFSFTWHPMKDDNSVDMENETLIHQPSDANACLRRSSATRRGCRCSPSLATDGRIPSRNSLAVRVSRARPSRSIFECCRERGSSTARALAAKAASSSIRVPSMTCERSSTPSPPNGTKPLLV